MRLVHYLRYLTNGITRYLTFLLLLSHTVVMAQQSPSNPITASHTTMTPTNGRAEIGDVVTRCFVFQNTANADFSGDLVFRDTLAHSYYQGSWIKYVGTPVVKVGGQVVAATIHEVSDSVVQLSFPVVNLPQSGEIEICDYAEIVRCGNGAPSRGKSRATLAYGCPVDTSILSCTNYVATNPALIENRRHNKVAKLDLSTQIDKDGCLDKPGGYTHLYTITNTGGAKATDLVFSYRYPQGGVDLGGIDFDDPSTYTVYYLDNSSQPVTVPVQQVLASSHIGDFTRLVVLDTLFELMPNATFFMEVNTVSVCPIDEEAAFDAGGVTIRDTELAIKFKYPCGPSNPHKFFYKKKREIFSLTQQIQPAQVSMLGDDEQQSFAVRNVSELRMGRKNTNPNLDRQYFFDADHFKLQIELDLEAGLCFENLSQVVLHSNYLNEDIIPVGTPTLTMTTGASGTCEADGCSGGTAVFTFELPADHFTTLHQSGVNFSGFSQKHLQFFSDFELRYDLSTECDCKTSDEALAMEQRFYAIYNDTCAYDCRIPVNRVEKKIQLNCPGCYLPGWNLTDLTIQRTSLEDADSDNDHRPDAISQQADPNLAAMDRMALGDEVTISASAAISDGDNSLGGFTFASAGFDYTEGQFVLDGADLLPLLTLKEVQLSFTNNSNLTLQNYTLTPTQLSNKTHFNTSGDLILSLDAADWHDFGLSGFVKYDTSQSIVVAFVFDVTGNLTTGVGVPQYTGVYYVTGKYHMSGTAFDDTVEDGQGSGGFKTDALTVAGIDQEAGATRSEYFYWCTHWEGAGIGVGISDTFTVTTNDHAYGTVCERNTEWRFAGATGMTHAQFSGGTLSNAFDVFPFELRNYFQGKEATVEIPTGYQLERVAIRIDGLQRDGNLTTKNTYTSNHFYNRLIPSTAGNVSVANGVATIYLSSPPLDTVAQYDESKSYHLWAYFIPLDCSTDMSGTEAITVGIEVEHHPLAPSGNMQYSGTDVISLAQPDIFFTVEETHREVGQNGSSMLFDVDIIGGRVDIAQPGIPGGTDHRTIPNIFMHVSSVHGSLSNIDVHKPAGNSTWASVAQSGGIFQLEANPKGGHVFGRRLMVDYNCSAVNKPDSLVIVVGYGCAGPVQALSEACELDTFYLELPYDKPDIAGSHTLALPTCNTTDYQVVIDAIGGTVIENVVAQISLPTGVVLAGSTATLAYDGQVSTVGISGSGPTYTVDLTGLLDGFIGLGSAKTTATLDLPLTFTCDYADDTIATTITATDFCGQALDPVVLTTAAASGIPAADYNLLQLSNLTHTPVSDDCEAPGTFAITVDNMSATASGDFEIAFYCTVDGGGTLSPACSLGSSGVTQVAPGGQQTVTFTPPAGTCPDCQSVIAVLVPLGDCICTPNTDTLTVDTDCNSCEEAGVTVDFSYYTTEDCEIKLENLSYANVVLTYLWEIRALDGTLLNSSTDESPTLSVMAPHTDFTVCLTVSDPTGSCVDSLCKSVYMCCVDSQPECELDVEIDLAHNPEICEYTFTVNSTAVGAASVDYRLEIWQGTTLAQTFGPTTGVLNATFTPAVSGAYTILGIAEWITDSTNCIDTTILLLDLQSCIPPCAHLATIQMSALDDCTYSFYLDNPPAGTVTAWSITDADAVTVASGTAAQLDYQPTQSGLYYVSAVITYSIDGNPEPCTDTLYYQVCLNACPPPCQYDGDVLVKFNGNKCLYSFELTNSASLSGAVITWSVIDPANNTVAYGQNPLGTRITFNPMLTGWYQISTHVQWQEGKDTCTSTIVLDRNLGACSPPCDFEGDLKVSVNDDCTATYSVDQAPAGATYTWSVTDESGNVISLPDPSAASITLSPTQAGAYGVAVTLSWSGRNTECSETLSTTRCLEACEADATGGAMH